MAQCGGGVSLITNRGSPGLNSLQEELYETEIFLFNCLLYCVDRVCIISPLSLFDASDGLKLVRVAVQIDFVFVIEFKVPVAFPVVVSSPVSFKSVQVLVSYFRSLPLFLCIPEKTLSCSLARGIFRKSRKIRVRISI